MTDRGHAQRRVMKVDHVGTAMRHGGENALCRAGHFMCFHRGRCCRGFGFLRGGLGDAGAGTEGKGGTEKGYAADHGESPVVGSLL